MTPMAILIIAVILFVLLGYYRVLIRLVFKFVWLILTAILLLAVVGMFTSG
ncbi:MULTISPECIES: hypothetical protein [Halocynthiibacter]|uniref:Uncharacterized protein n=1 Tax=Halocynthiibacter halioticoli TaxID=2986804 RepID=A0AAE3J1H5_9RHOB|nr:MULTISPECIES: hypothetical protein [Halocynthiibacter]MCV6824401.1 hypothetical protein [Halocynthiibacter halioticoli]MCW4057402.1 hypothetical protein [Halocynthiibacter sp. SDUM655004]MDE0589560.1 hypothetical protein [Halocynthiibacter sp. C4]